MKRPVAQHSIFLDGAARYNDLIFLLLLDNKLVAESVKFTRIVAFDRGVLGHVADRNWHSVAIGVTQHPTEGMLAVGEDGQVITYIGGNVFEEVIKPKPITLRGLGVVDGFAVACGMDRQVFRRVAVGSWAAMHAPPPNNDEDGGFEAIDGFGIDEMYAVGWEGEIWEWNGKKWKDRSSPTNLILTAVCCAGNGNVYVAGQQGTLLRGRYGQWAHIDLEDFDEDFWDLIWFNDQLYLATMSGLYKLVDDGLEPIDFGEDEPGTCYRLTAAEGVLWSVGAADVFSFDGTKWTRVD